MRIAIDGNEANTKTRVGVHQYAFEIITNIYRLNENSNTKNVFTIYLKDKPLRDLPKENEYWKYEVLATRRVWILTKFMPHLLKHLEHDVLFVPSHYTPPISRIPVVCTIHDLGYLNFSGQFKLYDFWQLKWWTAISLYISKYIISVSKATQKDIVRHYGRGISKKTQVVYHGLDHTKYNLNITNAKINSTREKYSIPINYILSLGTLKPSKNVEGVIKAFAKIAKFDDAVSLVVSGKKGWLYESIYDLVKKLNLEEKVVFTGFIKEDDKPAILSGARLLISPSFWEGFGMHILESYACGTPAVVSPVASMPEVAGDFAIYVDPLDIDDISHKTENVLKLNEEEYNKLSLKCVKHASHFTWEKSARDTLKVLKSASSNV